MNGYYLRVYKDGKPCYVKISFYIAELKQWLQNTYGYISDDKFEKLVKKGNLVAENLLFYLCPFHIGDQNDIHR